MRAIQTIEADIIHFQKFDPSSICSISAKPIQTKKKLTDSSDSTQLPDLIQFQKMYPRLFCSRSKKLIRITRYYPIQTG